MEIPWTNMNGMKFIAPLNVCQNGLNVFLKRKHDEDILFMMKKLWSWIWDCRASALQDMFLCVEEFYAKRFFYLWISNLEPHSLPYMFCKAIFLYFMTREIVNVFIIGLWIFCYSPIRSPRFLFSTCRWLDPSLEI